MHGPDRRGLGRITNFSAETIHHVGVKKMFLEAQSVGPADRCDGTRGKWVHWLCKPGICSSRVMILAVIMATLNCPGLHLNHAEGKLLRSKTVPGLMEPTGEDSIDSASGNPVPWIRFSETGLGQS